MRKITQRAVGELGMLVHLCAAVPISNSRPDMWTIPAFDPSRSSTIVPLDSNLFAPFVHSIGIHRCYDLSMLLADKELDVQVEIFWSFENINLQKCLNWIYLLIFSLFITNNIKAKLYTIHCIITYMHVLIEIIHVRICEISWIPCNWHYLNRQKLQISNWYAYLFTIFGNGFLYQS